MANIEHRVRELETKFEKSTGHKHTGGGGDAPTLPGSGFTFSCTATGLTWTPATGVLSLTALYAIPLATDIAKGVSAYNVMHTQGTDTGTTATSFYVNSGFVHPTSYELIITSIGLTGDYILGQTKFTNWDLAYSSIHAAVSLGASHGSLSLAGQVLSWDGVSSSCTGLADSATKWGTHNYPNLTDTQIVCWNGAGAAGAFASKAESTLVVASAAACSGAAASAVKWAGAWGVTGALGVATNTLDVVANGIAYSMMQNVAQYSILGRAAAGTGNLAEIVSAGAGTKYLRDDLTWQTVTGSMLALPNGQVYVGKADGSGAAAVAMSGDVSIIATGAATIAAEAVTVAKMHASATGVFFGRKTATAGAGEEIAAADARTIISKSFTVQTFLSGSGTYTLPTGCKFIKVRMVAGGGGGEGVSNGVGYLAGGAGGNSQFGTVYVNGGSGAPGTRYFGAGGTGGSGTATFRIAGGDGGSGGILGEYCAGAIGGSSAFGGAGASGFCADNGGAGKTNSGGGGGGAGAYAGWTSVSCAGGGAGEYAEIFIGSPSATYSYAVGAGGTKGDGASADGGSGGSGIIIVEEYYT